MPDLPDDRKFRLRLAKLARKHDNPAARARRRTKRKDVKSDWPHETIRSAGVIASVLVALISLGVAATSLTLQLRPKAERISIEVPELIATGDAFNTRRVGPLPSGSHSLVGPFVWRVTISNESDRAVSFIHLETRLEDVRAGQYYISGQYDGASVEGENTAAFPFVVPPYESRVLLVRGYMPGFLTLEAQAKCLSKGTTPAEFNQCAINTGTDIFGNKLELIRDGDRVLGAQWPSTIYQPSLVLLFKSSSGKLWSTKATVFPAYMPIKERADPKP